MKKEAKLSPFANKVYELARNLRLTAEHLKQVQSILSSLLSRCEDLPLLSQELDLTEEEQFAIATKYMEVKSEAEQIILLALECKDRTETLAKNILSDQYFAEFLGREAVSPFAGIYTPDLLKAARKIGKRYLSARKDRE